MALDVATTTYDLTEVVPVYSQDCPPLRIPVELKVSTTFTKGTVLGRKDSDGKYAAYASGASDGTQVPRAICPRTVTTDSSGNITRGTGSTGGQFGETELTESVYFGGIFKTGDLTGLDANAVSASVGMMKLLDGTYSSGIVKLI